MLRTLTVLEDYSLSCLFAGEPLQVMTGGYWLIATVDGIDMVMNRSMIDADYFHECMLIATNNIYE